MKTDVEIARSAQMQPISAVAAKLGLEEEEIESYGRYKAKINIRDKELKGKLILVTAMNPTRYGEGKTTVSIGLADALSQLGKKSCIALREPSLGPVFGIKGGACGGGYSQVVPMEDINLHFTGDFHALTSANNLLSALIDNHIKQGNSLGIANVAWKRCIDLNDRALREIRVCLGGDINGVPRNDGFVITAASEIMAVLCLASSINDLKERLAKIIIGYGLSGEEITVRDLKAQEAMTILLKEAIKPNLVQTLEGTPAIIHGGPFANIAHGCNSIIATRTALAHSEYTVTEAGFGAELGGEKFIDIKCRLGNLNPRCAVLVTTVRSIKFNAKVSDELIQEENLSAIKKGFENVRTHIENLTGVFKIPAVVAINRFSGDTEAEIATIKTLCAELGVQAVPVTCFADGGKGAASLAAAVAKLCENKAAIEYVYHLNDPLKKKIEKIAKKIYRAGSVSFSEESLQQITKIEEKHAYRNLPVCIAKTQYSFSCDANAVGSPKGFEFSVKEVIIRAGAGFVLVVCTNILLMPGLPASPNSERMSINGEGEISGLS
ncbi:MAG: formate--tetrahydrofolate ligase [Clostridia bacterium]|nr:formate--tetrahydrofolate ligase [Clostridia bacterium]